jgi:hypothetical protein
MDCLYNHSRIQLSAYECDAITVLMHLADAPAPLVGIRKRRPRGPRGPHGPYRKRCAITFGECAPRRPSSVFGAVMADDGHLVKTFSSSDSLRYSITSTLDGPIVTLSIGRFYAAGSSFNTIIYSATAAANGLPLNYRASQLADGRGIYGRVILTRNAVYKSICE